MAQPKRKTSLARKRRRIRSHKRTYAVAGVCTSCGAPALPHRVCGSCGEYRGRKLVSQTVDED